MAKKRNNKTKQVKKINKIKKKSSVSIKSILIILPNTIKFIFVEFFNVIKSIFMGIFSIFDFIFSFTISFFSYIYWGIKNIANIIWKYFLGMLYNETKYFFLSLFGGAKYLFSVIFYDFPLLVYDKTSKYVYDVYNSIKLRIKIYKDSINEKSKSFNVNINLKEYVINKYNELSFVKEAREKREASLMVLTINPNGDDAQRNEVKQTYRYLARNKEGKLIKGYFAALSRLDVYSYLIDEGMTVYEIETSWSINFFHAEASNLKRKMKTKDLIFWLAQLSTYIKAGIPLTDAVKVLAKQDKRKRYKHVYDSIIYELTMGESFSESLKKQGNIFPALLINMVKSAELIGDVESTLDEMSEYYQEIEDTKKAIIGAVAYPAIILIFAVVVVTFMLVYIIPKFVNVYESMNAELNPITQVTLNISAFLQNQYMVILISIAAIVITYIYMYKNIKAFRALMQFIFMHLPVIGNLIIYKEMALFARTFATLNKNNILLTDSIDILGKITNNEMYKGIMYHTINNLLKGEKMSDSFKDHWAVPEIAYYMILTGESTGELSSMLDKVGDFYQKQQRNSVGLIKTFIEPILIVFLAVAVGFIVVSIIIPMFGIYNTIS
ncbi:MAG: type II secretion system F family protein [Tenericutes bacterium]|nr:type II secretion system F family protein [Mycoplasmatota bacterium]